jgi:hypothetical protein
MRNKREYLPRLLEFINLANKIDPNFNFPSFERVLIATEATGRDEVETYRELLDKTSDEIQQFIFRGISDGGGIINENEVSDISPEVGQLDHLYAIDIIKSRIALLASLRQGIIYLATMVMEELTGDSLSANEYLTDARRMDLNLAPFLQPYVFISDEGFLRVSSSLFFDFVRENEIEAYRIRACAICYHIFWAYRLDKICCSVKCGNKYRQANYLSNDRKRQNVNENRRLNYAYKQSVKQQKEGKKNGTL